MKPKTNYKMELTITTDDGKPLGSAEFYIRQAIQKMYGPGTRINIKAGRAHLQPAPAFKLSQFPAVLKASAVAISNAYSGPGTAPETIAKQIRDLLFDGDYWNQFDRANQWFAGKNPWSEAAKDVSAEGEHYPRYVAKVIDTAFHVYDTTPSMVPGAKPKTVKMRQPKAQTADRETGGLLD